MKTFIMVNLFLSINGFNHPNVHIKTQKSITKFGRKGVLKEFSVESGDLQSPSTLAKHVYDEFSNYGMSQSFADFQISLQKHQIEGVALLTQNEQVKGIVSIDNAHGIGNYDISNFHVTKLIPSLVSGLLYNLEKNSVNYDILYLPEPFSPTAIVSSFIQIAVLYLIGSVVLQGIVPQFKNNPMNMITGSGSSSYTEVESNEITVNFTSVAGCDEAKYELVEVVDFLKQPQKYERAGAKIPKGVLLEGPPGTGKTLLAQAVAGEANVNYLYASGSQFIEMYVGVGASRVRNLFQRAKELSPCVIFLDEIDAIGRQRGAGLAGGNDEREQTLNEILTNMDGFIKNEGIIVIAATNRADILDNALTRPGRFDRKVLVPLPDMVGRRKIIDIHFKDKKLHKAYKSGYLDELAKLTGGFSGADIANLANEAAILSVRYNESYITDNTIYDAFEKMTIGLPSATETRSEEVVKMVSAHEVGHALMAHLFKEMFKIQKVTINSNKNGAGGYTLFTPKGKYEAFPTKKFLLANLMISLGGRAAEQVYYKHKGIPNQMDGVIFKNIPDLEITTGASNDLKQANSIARRYVSMFGMGKNIGLYDGNDASQPFLGKNIATNSDRLSEYSKQEIDNEIEELVKWAYEQTRNIIEKNSGTFNNLTDLLVEARNLDSDDFDKIILKY
uniref:AAA+ ATPase domain-containing protein n=1 Tax=viral metagenome TaxID=1070528 RepID=A0A6C0KY01_9ZZZZ|tara:strand:+ start:14505 stop:16526 length:2022 start_codon:yes stop_codon:yes gene_type:complete